MILQLRLLYRFPRNAKFAVKNSAILLHNSKAPFSTTTSSFMPRKPKFKPFENEEEANVDSKWKDYAPGARNLFDEVRSSTNFGSVRVDDDNVPQVEKEVIVNHIKTEFGGAHTESFSKINAHKSDYLSLLMEEKENRFSPVTPLVLEDSSTPGGTPEEDSVAKQNFSFGKFRENKTIPVNFEQSLPSEQTDLNYFDNLMFHDSYSKFSHEEASKIREVHVDPSVEIAREQFVDPELNLIDQEYFSPSLARPAESKNEDNFVLEKSDDLNYIDEQFFTPQPESSSIPLAESETSNLTFSEHMLLLQEATEDRQIKQPPKLVLEELSSSNSKVQPNTGTDHAQTASWFESDMAAFNVAAFDPVDNEVDSEDDSDLKARMNFKRAQKLPADTPEKPLPKSSLKNSSKKSDNVKTLRKSQEALEYVRKLRKSQDSQTAPTHPHERLGHHLQDRFLAATSNLQGSNTNQRLSVDDDDDEAVEHVGVYEDVKKYKPPDLDSYIRLEMRDLLFSKIVYNDHDIVALWKPHGLPMFLPDQKKTNMNNKGRPAQRYSLECFLPFLAKQLEVEKLYEVHRLDSTTTGVILYAKTKEMELKLRKLFLQKKVEKTYLCICNGVPQGDSGVIDIPVGEGTVDGRRRMTLRPDFDASQIISNKKSSKGNVSKALTQYRVVSSHNNASLVQTKMLTGRKHQIRLHLGLGLGCPILGDHKFSYPDQLGKPQKVKGDIVQRLNIRKSKSRELPIFLHARKISIPDIIPDGNLVIRASLPHFFTKTMKRLKLKGSRNDN